MSRAISLSSRLAWLAAAAFTCAAQSACGEIAPFEEPPLEPPVEPPPPEPPPPPPVGVTVLSSTGDGAPEVGASVLFVASDGRLAAEAIADSRGRSQAELPGGGAVHAVRLETVRGVRFATIRTVTGVQPGDDIVIGESRRLDAPSALPEVQMTGSFTSAGTGARHSFFTECGAVISPAGTTFTLPLRGDCGRPRLRVFGTALLANGTFAFATVDIDVAGGGRFVVPNNWTPMASFSVVAKNTPRALFSLGINRHTLLGAGASPALAGLGAFNGAPTPGSNTLTIPFAPGTGTRALLEAFISTATPPSQLLSVRTADVASSQELDLAELEVPWLLSLPVVSATGAAWTQRDAGRPDVRLVTWRGVVRAGDLTTNVTWTIADDRVADTFTLPGLPSAFAAIDPTKQAAASVTATSAAVQYVDHSELAGYAQARRVAFDAASSPRISGLFSDRAYRVRSVSSEQ